MRTMQTETRTVESQRSSEALELFLRGASRESTRAVGAWVWSQLRDKPEGAALNLSAAARELGLSRESVHRAMRCFLRWGRISVIHEYRVGSRAGRPRAYTLHAAYLKADADGVCISAKRVNFPQAPYKKTSQKHESLKATATGFSPSPALGNAQMPTQLGETTPRTLREVVRDRRRVSLRASRGSVARTLAALREALGTWTGPRLQAAGIVPDDPLADPSDFAMDLRREIQTAFAVALWRKCRQGTYLAAWNSAHDELVATIAAMPEDEGPDGRLAQLAEGLAAGEGGRRQLYGWVCRLVHEVVHPRQRRVERELDRLTAEEARLRERIACDRDRLSGAEAREILARARGQREPVDGGETHLVPAEPRRARVALARRVRPPIGDPADLDRRRAELIARLEEVQHGLR